MAQARIGDRIPRVEDDRFLRGRGRYTDDASVDPGRDGAVPLHGVVVRAADAHATIVSIDTAAAVGVPGVRLVLTGADIAALGSIPPTHAPGFPDGRPMVAPPYPALATDRIRHVGEPLAFIVADTVACALDAAERVTVETATLPAVVEPEDAVAPGAPAVWDAASDNVAFDFRAGDAGAVDRAFAAAAHVVRLRVVNNRVVVAPIEPRAALAWRDDATGRLHIETSTQMPHGMRDLLAGVLGVAPGDLRVVVRDVGGGFGIKNSVYPEQVLVLEAARRLGRPVRWVAERTESFVADAHARDNVSAAELALDAEGRMLALRVDTLANLGARVTTRGAVSPTVNVAALAGPYRLGAIDVRVRGVFTNTVPTDVYRGAGRPEAIFVIERLVDRAARALGLAPVALRRRNLLRPDELPFTTGTGLVYDEGDFPAQLDAALAAADAEGFPARRRESVAAGRRRGLGVATLVEACAGRLDETAVLQGDADGGVTLLIGAQSNGQGHETTFAQMVSAATGLDMADLRVVEGDTDRVATGRGTGGSWSTVMSGSAVHIAAEDLAGRLTEAAADRLEAAGADIVLADGFATVAGTDRRVALTELVASAAAAGAPLGGDGFFAPSRPSLPAGCHVAEVEVDPETGRVTLARYTFVHDSGRLINPMLVEGQFHGGIAQGVGQALTEHVVHDAAGQLLAGSFMDYCLPRADDLPALAFRRDEHPTDGNPLGAKGCGEMGCAAAPPAVVNAVLDALAGEGIHHIDMPLTPHRVWQAMAAARGERRDAA